MPEEEKKKKTKDFMIYTYDFFQRSLALMLEF